MIDELPVIVGDAEVLRETAKAILVNVDGDEVWIPKIAVHDNSEVWDQKNAVGELVVKAWFARKEGWE